MENFDVDQLKSTDNVVETMNRNSQIRSILLFDIDAVRILFTITSLTNYKLLKVLDFEDASLYSVPEDLGNLFHLRNTCRRGIGSMVELQKLCYVEANHEMGLIEELGKLRQLRKLGITNLMEEDRLSLCASISNMKHLESLCICSNDDDILKLETVSVAPRYLRTLYLQGCLSRLPEWLPTLRSLVCARFRRSRLSYDTCRREDH
ncbi:hypothetical protein AAG906_006124 [Vitis piasezkii]